MRNLIGGKWNVRYYRGVNLVARLNLRLSVAVTLFAWVLSAKAALPAYYFADFETSAGWKAGPLPSEKLGLRLIQGEAAVITSAEDDSLQELELGPSSPFPAVFVEALSVAKAPVVFCDLLAKPAAVEDESDAEFFDFGGAILGFFQVGERGEVRALFSRSAEESVWISTGATFDLGSSGLAARWLRIAVRLDRRSERWDLRINGITVLTGLRAIQGQAAGLPLWLYGQESQASQFDDLLLTAIEPEHLEKMIEWQRRREARVGAVGPGLAQPKLITRAKSTAELRSGQSAIQNATRALVAPVLREWEGTLKIGDASFTAGPEVDIGGKKHRLLIYSPQYDKSGQPLPGVFTITADAELRPGIDLSQIRWLMAEMKSLDGMGEVFAAGDFQTGLIQSVAIPAEWIRKATTSRVWVAPNELDAHWLQFSSRQKPGSLPFALPH